MSFPRSGQLSSIISPASFIMPHPYEPLKEDKMTDKENKQWERQKEERQKEEFSKHGLSSSSSKTKGK
jgi:hypothetical protein